MRSEYEGNLRLVERSKDEPLRFNNSRIRAAIIRKKKAEERRKTLLLVLAWVTVAAIGFLGAGLVTGRI